MSNKYIFMTFGSMFPYYENDVDVWYPNGKDSVRIKFKTTRSELIFTYYSEKEWCLETAKNYLRKTEKEDK